MRCEDVIRDWERMEGGFANWRNLAQECADFMLPDRADFITRRAPGSKRMSRVFEATPIWALEQFAAGMHALNTSPTLQWFALKAEDDHLNNDDQVQRWLDAVTAKLYGVFNSPRYNFASQSHELYRDLGIGHGIMAVLEGREGGPLFSTRHQSECVFDENDEDRVDRLVRKWKWTARQAYAAWGDKAGEKVRQALEKNDSQTFEFLHWVGPRRDRIEGRRDARHKAFASIYVSLADKTTIAEGGFDEFPYLVPRLAKAPGEVTGRGPAMTLLPDVKMLNEMQRTIMKAAQKIVDPPMMAPDSGFLTPLRTVPGALNIYARGSQDRIEPIQTGGDVRLGVEMLNTLRNQIIRGFYVEWMLMPSDPRDPASAGKGVTATYVLQQRDEKMRLLSPLLARLQSEFTGPLIDRVYAMMVRQSAAERWGENAWLPPPPANLNGKPLRVEYVSPIAIAQKTSQLDSVARLIQIQMELRQLDPEAPLEIDIPAIMRLAGRDLNTPAVALKSDAQKAAEAQQRAEAQAMLANHQALANVAGAARDGGAAIKNLAQAAGAMPGMMPANDTQEAA